VKSFPFEEDLKSCHTKKTIILLFLTDRP